MDDDKHTGAEPPTCPYCGGAVEIAGHPHATCVEAAASRNTNAANPPPNTALHKIIACETCAFTRAVLEAALKGKP